MNTLQVDVFPYLLKEYLINLIIFLSITVLALFVILIFHKLLTERRGRKKNGFVSVYRTYFTQCINDDTLLPQKPESGLQFEAFAEVCIEQLKSASFKAAEKVKCLLKDSGTVEHFRKIVVSSSSWPRRFYSMETLGFFMMDDLINVFKEVVHKDRSPEIKTKALWAWSLIAQEEDLEPIARLLMTGISNSSKFNVYIFTNVIGSLRKMGRLDAAVNFLRHAKEAGDQESVIVRDFIEACGASGFKESAGLINDYFYSYSKDPLMKIACIRALGAIGCLNSRTTMFGLTDTDWRVRAVSAKAAHVIDAIVLNRLRRLLYDFVYIVRINSAKKLAQSGAKGMAVLEKELNSSDRFVRDTVHSIIEAAQGVEKYA